MLEDLARGKQILRSEHYRIVNVVAAADRVAVQVEWTGVLAVPVGALREGDTMRALSAVFLTFAGGKITEQQNHDCFDDFLTPRG